MGEAAEELRGQLAQQRQDLSRDVEAIGDRVVPGRVVDRKKAAARQRFDRARDAVMGAADSATGRASDAMSSVQDKASSLAGTVGDAPDMARERAQGSPVAAGLIAFGAGLLVGSLVPGQMLRSITLSDKIMHVGSYFVLMIWFAGLYHRNKHPIVAGVLIALGIMLDMLQGATRTRSATTKPRCGSGRIMPWCTTTSAWCWCVSLRGWGRRWSTFRPRCASCRSLRKRTFTSG